MKIPVPTLEQIDADLATRRAAPFPPRVTGKLDTLVAEHASLPWPAPVCGSIQP